MPSGNWYCPTCAPILGITSQRQNGHQSSHILNVSAFQVDPADETFNIDQHNQRPQEMYIDVGDCSGEEAGPEGHSYSLRSSAIGRPASRGQHGSAYIPLDSSSVVNLDRTSVIFTESDSDSDSDSDMTDTLCQQYRRHRRPSRQLLLSSDDEITNVNLVSSGNESDGGSMFVRRRGVRRQKVTISLMSSDSESRSEVDGYVSGSGEAEVVTTGEEDSSFVLSCESEDDGWDSREVNGLYSSEEESKGDSVEGTMFNDASAGSIHSGCGEASSSDVTRKGKTSRKGKTPRKGKTLRKGKTIRRGKSPSSHPGRSSKNGLRAARTTKGKERAKALPRKKSRKRQKITMQPVKGSSSQPARKKKKNHRMFKGKSRKKVTKSALPRKRHLSAGESSGTNSGGAVICIPETPEAKRRPTPGYRHTHATPTLALHSHARVAASTPTSSLRQAKVQQAVREYAATGSLPHSRQESIWEQEQIVLEPGQRKLKQEQRKLEAVSNDQLIADWVQSKHRSPSWMREAVDRRKAERGSPSQTRERGDFSSISHRRGATSSMETSGETPSRKRWRQAELKIPKYSCRTLPQVKRCDGCVCEGSVV